MRHLHMCFLCIMALTTLFYIFFERPHFDYIESLGNGPNEINDGKRIFHIVVVACGQRTEETLIMIKSAILFNDYQECLKFLIFTEDPLTETLREKLTDWRDLMPNIFDFELLPLKFPTQSKMEWKTLFKPCAAQRLFLPILRHNNTIIIVDNHLDVHPGQEVKAVSVFCGHCSGPMGSGGTGAYHRTGHQFSSLQFLYPLPQKRVCSLLHFSHFTFPA
ncbi:glucoside xylosyltransferase 2 isoform X2 [Drosophila innubila]|uniref:glucoside xylosyltransferase 2 isoform X2 n=1 Tax=Drosophila innubila TaxID=198719 RepID=UPI00148CBE1A|nr:glucoside xylosyltransferase 2 isoform X2 [Drosophila innubila]